MSTADRMVAAGTSPSGAGINWWLLGGGVFSLAFAALHVCGIWFPPSWIRWMGGPAELRSAYPLAYAGICMVVATVAAGAGVYALSGAGCIRRLPWVRVIVSMIALGYLSRGAMLLRELPQLDRSPWLWRFVGFSSVALVVGLMHLVGSIQLFRARGFAPDRSPSH